jgi:hypothetical protein
MDTLHDDPDVDPDADHPNTYVHANEYERGYHDGYRNGYTNANADNLARIDSDINANLYSVKRFALQDHLSLHPAVPVLSDAPVVDGTGTPKHDPRRDSEG